MQPSFEKYPSRFRVQDSANRATILNRHSRSMVRVLGSDPKRLHGAAPQLNIYDEVAQWPPGQVDAMLSALNTAMGKMAGARAIWTGTRPDRPTHPFAQALAGGVGFAQVFAAEPDDDPLAEETWLKANPSLPYFPDLKERIAKEAARAASQPSLLTQFKALRLNMGISDIVVADLIQPETWERIQGTRCRWGPTSWASTWARRRR